MYSEQNRNHGWRVLLIGGSSGVGKTVAARALAKHLSLPLLLLDDVRLALQAATSNETHPELHCFMNYKKEQWRNSESICADWITVGKALTEPLNAIIHHHLIVPDVGAIIIEGDGILPLDGNQSLKREEVRAIFIVEHDETQLLNNLRARGRGFNEWDELEQKSFAHASWLHGQWLAQEARNLGLPVLHAQPQPTLYERLLSIAGL
jgi:2-phosphoglycerate kinase